MEDLTGMLADPDANAPRLAWAERCGDPERAELIRLQCAIHEAKPGDPVLDAGWDRASALVEANFDRWFGKVAALVNPSDVWRGFVTYASGTVADVIAHADALAEVSVELTLNIEDVDADLGELANHALLERVRRVEFDATVTNTPDFTADFLQGPKLTHLRSITFSEDENALETVRAIDSYLPLTVTSVNFAGYATTTFDDSAAQVLCSSPRVAQLENLGLYNCNLTRKGAEAIGNGTFLGLSTLYLGMGNHTLNNIGSDGVKALVPLTRLKHLDLDFNGIGDKGIKALRRSFRHLERLHLQANDISDRGLAMLCDSPVIRQLRFLDLRHNRITAKGLAELLRAAPYKLKELWISDGPGTDALAASHWARQLDHLRIL